MKPRRLLCRKTKRRTLVLTLGGYVLMAGGTMAATDYWDNNGGTANDWGSLANWSTVIGGGTNPAALPGTNDIATFSATPIQGTAQTINLNGNRSVQGLSVLSGVTVDTTLTGGGTVTRNLTIGSSGIVNASSGNLTIGTGYTTSPAPSQRVDTLFSGSASVTNNGSGEITFTSFLRTNAGQTITFDGTGSGKVLVNNVNTSSNSGKIVMNTGSYELWMRGDGLFSGGLEIKQGLVFSGAVNNNSLGTGGVTLGGTGDATLKLMSDFANNYANAITLAGSGALKIQIMDDGNGLTNSHTFTGGITGSNNITIDQIPGNGGNKDDTVTFSTGAINHSGSLTHTGTADADLTISSVIGTNVTGVIQNSATSKMVLTGTNTYTGGTTISAGTLQLGAGGTAGALSASSAISISSGATFATNRSDTVTQGTHFSNAAITGAGGFTQSGSGTTIFNVANTFSGNTLVSAGTLRLDHLSAIQNSPLDTSGAGVVNANAGSGNYVIGGLIGSKNLSSVITTNLANVTTLTLNPQSGKELTYSGVIDGSGRALTKTGTGTQILSGTNTYTGATTISAGTLRAGAAASGQAFGNGSAVTMANVSGATLDLNNFSQTIGSLAGGGGTGGNVTLGSGTLTTGGNNTSTSYSGVISGSGGLTKNGSGTQTLTGANSYTGATTISAGTLQLGAGGTTGTLSTSSAISISSGAIFAINRSNTVTQGTDFRGAAITGAGGLTQSGTGTTILNQANTYTGATTVNAGRLIVGSGGSGSITSAVTVNSGGTLGGSGTIIGNVTINSNGIHAPGNSPGIQTVTGNLTYESGSIFAWELDANKSNNSGGGIVGTDYDGVDVSGTLDIDPGAVFRVVIGDNVNFGNSFWASEQSWSDIFDYGSLTGGWAAGTPVSVYTYDSATNTYTYVDVEGSFTITGTTLNWTPIPEPGSVLAGALIGAGLLRRRRPAANPRVGTTPGGMPFQ